MRYRSGIFIFAFLLAGALSVTFLVLAGGNGAACDRTAVGLEEDAPLVLAAMLDDDCLRAYLDDEPGSARDALINFGRPLVVLERLESAAATELLNVQVTWGERSLLSGGAALVAALRDHRRSDEMEKVIDFVAANDASLRQSYEPFDQAFFLRSIPIWQDPEGQAFLEQACADFDCVSDVTVCPRVVGLADKLAVVRQETTATRVWQQCDAFTADLGPSIFDWASAMRLSGIVDTTCSFTLQMSAVRDAPELLESPCFGDGRQIGSYASVGSTDYVIFIKRKAVSGEPEQIDAASLTSIATHYPEIARYFATQ